MTATTNRREDFLNGARLLIDGTLTNPEIQTAVAVYGYDETKLSAGNAVLEEVVSLLAAREKEYGEQHDATVKMNETWDIAHKSYMKTLRIARVALQDTNQAPRSLKLTGERSRTLAGWLGETGMFYENLLASEELMTLMNRFGYNDVMLKQEQEMVKNMGDYQVIQRKEMGSAQDLTQILDAKMKELDRWVGDYRVVVKVALEDRPQLLEKVGIRA